MKKSILLHNIYFLVASILFTELALFIFKLFTDESFLSGRLQTFFNHSKLYISVIVILVFIYLVLSTYKTLLRIITTPRYDIITSSAIGIIFVLIITIRSNSIRLENLEIPYLFIFGAATLFFMYLAVIFTILDRRKNANNSNKTQLLSDNPWDIEDEDILDYKEIAEKFASKVIQNQSSKGSLVYGIEAPWGSGKTSFLKMTERQINEINKDKSIIIWFDPWNFNTETELISKFFEELYKSINEIYYFPELNPQIKNYLSALSALGIGQFTFHLSKPSDNLNIAKNNLVKSLSYIDSNIIIIIDDLDRIPLDKAKQIFRLVSLNANFANVTYILCYDLQNLYSSDSYTSRAKTIGDISISDANNSSKYYGKASLKQSQHIDETPIQKYLEKIVNIKFVLPYFHKDKLISYYSDEIHKRLFPSEYTEDNYKAPIKSTDISHALSEIFTYKGHIARNLLSTIRQFKLILNTFLACNEGDIDLIKYDIEDFTTVIYLILLKYHYPSIYSDICFYEYDRRRVSTENVKYFFAAKNFSLFASNESESNNPKYKQYIKDKSLDDTAIELLDTIFGDTINRIDNFTLVQYIKLIEGIPQNNLSKKIFYKFFENLSTSDMNSAHIISKFEDFVEQQYSLEKEPIEHVIHKNKLMKQFFRMYSKQLPPKAKNNHVLAEKLLTEIVDSYPKYSSYPISYWDNSSPYIENIRGYLQYSIINTLEDVLGIREEEPEKDISNVKKISHLLLGDTSEGIPSVLETIGRNQGVTFINDMLSLVHGLNKKIEIKRALYWHKVTNNGQEELTEELKQQKIEVSLVMEDINVKAFEIFKRNYIDENINVLKEIDNLTIDHLVGQEVLENEEWLNLIKNEDSPDYYVQNIKSDIEVFTLYSLCAKGNEEDGYRCGNYEYDGNPIRDIMLNYLFDICFSTEDNQGYKYFIDFLLRQLARNELKSEYVFNIEHIDRIVDRERLISYWKDNRANIKSYFHKKYDFLITANYIASYHKELTKDDNTGIFDILDQKSENM